MKGLVTVSIAPLMMGPPRTNEILDEALGGMVVELMEKDGCWRHVQTHYRYSGWMREEQLCINQAMADIWERAPKKVVMQAWTDVLTCPKVQGTRLQSLPRGALVVPEGAPAEGWQKVKLPDGRSGFTWAGFLGEHLTTWSRNQENTLREALAEAALSYMGVQYRWGGKTPLGVDCSGLCSMAYLLNGIVIFRDAAIMEGFPMKEITLAQAKKGDLLFFPGHVAMYLGDGRYVHATASGRHGVMINSLNPGDPLYRADLPPQLTAVGTIFAENAC